MDPQQNQYHFSFFKPTTESARHNRNMILQLVLIWTVAIFGFQVLLHFTQAAVGGSEPPPATGDVAAACTAAGYKLAQVIDMGWKNARYVTKGFRSDNVVVLHFMNWETPDPGPAARENLRESGTPPDQLDAEAWQAMVRVIFRLNEFVLILMKMPWIL